MNPRLWSWNRLQIRLAACLFCVACWPPAGATRAQQLGLTEAGQLRRLPPVESELPLLSFGDTADADFSLVAHAEPVIDAVPIDQLEETWLEEPPPIRLPDYVSDLAYAPFGRPYTYEGSGAPEQSNWIVGAGDRMGMFTLAMVQRGWWRIGQNRFQFNPAVRFVSGPKQTDLPPQLYDLDIGFVRRNTLLDSALSYELALRVGFFADFEGSAREGLRFPGHAVLYYQLSEQRQLILGVDYLDRDDIAVLPVVGAAFRPFGDLWIEAVFPKPRVAFRINSERWLYVGARMGGGTWAIERMGGEDDVVNYRDYQVVMGIQQDHVEGYMAFVELGWVFDRDLEYRSGVGDYSPRNTTILRTVLRY
jgi:hypothetical protein